MVYAAVLSAAQCNWQTRFRDLKLSKLKILQYILNINTFVLNTSQKLRALKNILINQQISLLFLELHIHWINFGALYSRCKPPGSRRSLFSRIHINSVGFKNCMFQDSRLIITDSPSFYSTIPNLQNLRLNSIYDLYQEGRLVKFDKSSITYPLKSLGRVPFWEKLINAGFILRRTFNNKNSKKSFAGWQKYWQRFIDLEQKTKD